MLYPYGVQYKEGFPNEFYGPSPPVMGSIIEGFLLLPLKMHPTLKYYSINIILLLFNTYNILISRNKEILKYTFFLLVSGVIIRRWK